LKTNHPLEGLIHYSKTEAWVGVIEDALAYYQATGCSSVPDLGPQKEDANNVAGKKITLIAYGKTWAYASRIIWGRTRYEQGVG
jgi:hypothetical protein